MYTTRQNRWVISAFTMSHSHSFLLLCFHFVYRYISIAKYLNGGGNYTYALFRYQWLSIFRTWWFLLFLIFWFILESIIWFCLLFFQYKTEQETFDELIPYLSEEYPNLTIEGVATAHYWRHDNTLRWRPFLGSAGFCSLMTFVLCIVIFCAVNVFRLLNNIVHSLKSQSMQRQLFYTLLVQVFSVPFFLMYLPVLLVITPPLFHISLNLPFHLMSSFFVAFPFLDALVILIGVRDYRMALFRVVRISVPSDVMGQTTTSNLRTADPPPVSSIN
ncbi:hypothetical protein PRIPAC_77383 [Pristionchus pacificus]|uniref:G protein-coupled receptor n=1 Tax=Pristionchus pacificus TaxID=54126 RepID=A0A2A6C1X7_PRIPA|nr:hypothetical protein PRIPAC_77383 [Pristionchus pacificus]|eukprot:PDM72136.1 G protein-coupled receptor [Pristionchus pacificus]